jgi:hypothetical protein
MSVYAYDESVVSNFRELFKQKVTINVDDMIFDFRAFISGDDIKMPIISLTRTGWSLLDNRPHAMKFTGGIVEYDEDTDKYSGVQMIPIRISYQVDVLTESRKENDLLLRELIFYLSTHPTLTVDIPYGLDIKHVFNLFISGDITDNSDISMHKEKGRYFRQTFDMYTDDAYLWQSYKHSNIKFGANLEVYAEEIERPNLIEEDNIYEILKHK